MGLLSILRHYPERTASDGRIIVDAPENIEWFGTLLDQETCNWRVGLYSQVWHKKEFEIRTPGFWRLVKQDGRRVVICTEPEKQLIVENAAVSAWLGKMGIK